MSDVIQVFLFVVAFIVFYAVGVFKGLDIGREQVASGRAVCELVEKPNKTTEWKCETVTGNHP